jgi:hypothetical protein
MRAPSVRLQSLLLALIALSGCPTREKLDHPVSDQPDGSQPTSDASQPHPDASHPPTDGGSPPPDANQPQAEGGIALPDAMVWNPSLQITSPGPISYVNGSVTVVMIATGFPSPPSVTLYVDDAGILTLDPSSDYRLTWDTAKVAEGTHTLRALARYDGRDVVSPSVMVLVDRTPPQIVSLTPEPGASDVSLRAPIQVRFSEPIAPATIASGPATLTFGSTKVFTTTTLSPDGLLGTIAITDVESVLLPANATVALAATLTDLAGNALVLPTAPWQWAVPSWFKYPNMIASSDMAFAVGADGEAVLIRNMNVDAQMIVLEGFQSEARSWRELGRLPNSLYGYNGAHGFSAAIATDGRPVVASVDDSPATSLGGPATGRLQTWSWNGTKWNAGPAPVDFDGDASGTWPSKPVLRLDSAGAMTMVWKEPLGTSQNQDIFLKRFMGTTWDEGYPRLGIAGVADLDLCLTVAGDPLVLFRYSGADTRVGVGTWRNHVPMFLENGAIDFTIAADGDGNPLVVDLNARVLRTSPAWMGTSWSLPTTTGSLFSLATTPDNRPVLAWIEGSSSQQKLNVAVWNGARWDARPIFDVAVAYANRPKVAVDGRGRLWVAWVQSAPMTLPLVNVWRSNYWGDGL